MKGCDWINSLPDEMILEILRHVDCKLSRDACDLVCKRWLRLERLSRDIVRIGASGSPDNLVQLLSQRFVNVKQVFVDERLSISLYHHYVSEILNAQFCLFYLFCLLVFMVLLQIMWLW